MKKCLSLLLCVALLVCFSACTRSQQEEKSNKTNTQIVTDADGNAVSQSDNSSVDVTLPDGTITNAVTSDILICYFSCTGNTAQIASYISKANGGDLFEIVPKQPYSMEDLDYKSKEINDYLKGLSEDKRIEVAAKNYAFDSDVKVNAYVYGFAVSKVKAFLSKKLGSKLLNCEETKFGKIVLEDDYNLEKPEGILLESEDKSFRVRLTLSEIIGQLLDKNREELSDALFRGQK